MIRVSRSAQAEERPAAGYRRVCASRRRLWDGHREFLRQLRQAIQRGRRLEKVVCVTEFAFWPCVRNVCNACTQCTVAPNLPFLPS